MSLASRRRTRRAAPWLAAFALPLVAATSSADLPVVPAVAGTRVAEIDLGTGAHDRLESVQHVAWDALATMNVIPGLHWVTFPVSTAAVLVPVCAGRKQVLVDDVDTHVAPGPAVIDVPRDGRTHRVAIQIDVSGYEHRIACSEAPRSGERSTVDYLLLPLTFESPHAASGGGHAVLYVPPGHDRLRRAPLLVALHPWNGSIWTYAAYEPLLKAARLAPTDLANLVILFPSGLGNSLYTANAEDEALRAMAATRALVPIDPDRVTLFGASMGGAGATTVGFHHPDMFAAIISFFGDSKYDLSTYVRGILHDGLGTHLVNALDVVDNARNVPVWLVHGEDDHVSPLAQSAKLDRALRAKHFDVRFDRVPGAGHEGRVVTDFATRIVDVAIKARRIEAPSRVSYWSVRPSDVEAYGIRITRASTVGDAFFDIERQGDSVHLLGATGVRAIHLPRGAFAFAPTMAPPVVCDYPAARDVSVTWDALP